ncbi:MAG: recombination regulator RecX [Propionibacteriaceae bacterium]|jgi:regulatory protein|nr:recombination regulator RecX [Propionibacteriaceae bacterium]
MSNFTDRTVGGRDVATEKSGVIAAPWGVQLERAREIALRKLDQRAYTYAELHEVLLKQGCPIAVVEELLHGFEDVGLLNDAEFALAWVASRHGHRNLSRRAVAAELRRKGIADELATEVLSGIDHESELRAAREVAASKTRALAGLTYPVAYRRLAGALGRRGYDSSVIAEVVKEALLKEAHD